MSKMMCPTGVTGVCHRGLGSTVGAATRPPLFCSPPLSPTRHSSPPGVVCAVLWWTLLNAAFARFSSDSVFACLACLCALAIALCSGFPRLHQHVEQCKTVSSSGTSSTCPPDSEMQCTQTGAPHWQQEKPISSRQRIHDSSALSPAKKAPMAGCSLAVNARASSCVARASSWRLRVGDVARERSPCSSCSMYLSAPARASCIVANPNAAEYSSAGWQ